MGDFNFWQKSQSLRQMHQNNRKKEINGVWYIGIMQSWGLCELDSISSTPKIFKKSGACRIFWALLFLENSLENDLSGCPQCSHYGKHYKI